MCDLYIIYMYMSMFLPVAYDGLDSQTHSQWKCTQLMYVFHSFINNNKSSTRMQQYEPLLSDAVFVPPDTLSVCLLEKPDSSSIDSIASAEAITTTVLLPRFCFDLFLLCLLLLLLFLLFSLVLNYTIH